ncbi:hypothetical protein LTR36_004657 [Oleoguttula mirabilis]|uniref:Uncharacterized protein n=1 Tax=Oleoguttula mirabilis TaxID=1507867 RepID=A0AAV9JGD1_9PEZI|nr:hypothetical protein LTR36_004657 [Oleoguttula mirabilis]
MQLTTNTIKLALATIGILQAWLEEVSYPLPTTEKRADSHHLCAGDSSGKTLGAFTCADVTFTDIDKIEYSIFARDTKGDSHEVYGFLRVYLAAGYYEDKGKVTDDHGHGTEVDALNLKYAPFTITGVRAEACVNDAGSDTCDHDGDFVANPFA